MSALRRTPDARREWIEHAYARAVRVVQPEPAVRRVLTRTNEGLAVSDQKVNISGRLIVIAIGKAACPMAAAASDCLGDRIDAGIVLTKDGHAANAPDGFAVFEAAHPVPDERGIEATTAILDTVGKLSEEDGVLALISGGGSALFEAPHEGLTLADVQRVTELLLRAGAPIQDLNAVRSELSQVKGGGFRRTIGRARTLSLILSDVLGNDPDVIASGPTIVQDRNPERAMRLIDAYGLLDSMPGHIVEFLLEAELHAKQPEDAFDDQDLYEIIGDNAQFVDAFSSYLEDQGLSVSHLWTNREGEARDCAVEWVNAAITSQATDVVIGGGELTVTVRGEGSGGRNTEFALAAVPALSITGEAMTVASLASDGQDGSADAAGAVVDETTAKLLFERGVDIERALEANDSATALSSIDALLSPGPTGTNVNDVYVAIRGSRHTR